MELPSGDQVGCVSAPAKLPVMGREVHAWNDATALAVQMRPPDEKAIFEVLSGDGDHVGSDAVPAVLVTWVGVPKPLEATVPIRRGPSQRCTS